MINMTLATLHPNTFPAPDRSWPCGPLDFPRLLTCIHDNPKQPSLKTPVRRCHGQLTTAIISTPRLAASPQAFCSAIPSLLLSSRPFASATWDTMIGPTDSHSVDATPYTLRPTISLHNLQAPEICVGPIANRNQLARSTCARSRFKVALAVVC